ncbi:uncharacterized protein B0P05DRAFT_533161 [Gilbertella persicaria]|uniref:uncharacterized protein n=1 Tax=Gilbertella persicaria TaxID=101096 RepID=UPI0022204274|nr:uncharacterized protein B0P05DRAFT_533161 [Gilbertella persicaria]KAI8086978.1 hypothetical protein B0P05DRAFT_533161 [Gilbertella persicaria]
MLKQSYNTYYYTTPSRTHNSHSVHLYDRARQDLFDNDLYRDTVPSITTICLLQIQASIIQVLAYLPYSSSWSLQTILKQCLRWTLLIGLLLLDNIARVLNVDTEMMALRSNNDYYHGQCIQESSGNPEPSSPTLVKRTVAPASPIPTYFPKTSRKASTNPPSPITLTAAETRSRASRTPGHVRSLSNTMMDKKLRRVTAQREITVQNAILPKANKKSDSARSDSSESPVNDRPRMQKTMSLSTAQQYHKQVEHKSSRYSFHEPKKPYERCCPACATHH